MPLLLMRLPLFNQVNLALLVAVLTAGGCDRSSAPIAPLSMEQLPATFEKAFSKAKPEVKDLANQVVSAVQSNAYASAYATLQGLSAVPTLTREQARIVGRGMVTINGLLQSAAAKGDENAAQAVQIYRSQK